MHNFDDNAVDEWRVVDASLLFASMNHTLSSINIYSMIQPHDKERFISVKCMIFGWYIF